MRFFALLTSLVLFNIAAADTSGGLSPRFSSTLRRITLPIHQHSPRALLSDEGTHSGITSLTMSTDRQSYYAVIKAGDISFRVALDTASSDLWIMSSACETSPCKAVPRYPLTYQSPSYVAVNDNTTTFNASYADGTVVGGYVAKETIELSNLTIAGQVFGLVTNSNVTMVDQISGVMGLGFPRLSSISNSVTNSTPFFVGLAQQGLLDYPLFGFSLTRNTSGTLSIGAIDSSIVTNASLISWNRVIEFAPFGSESNSSSYFQWAIPLTGFQVNGTALTPQPTYPGVTGNLSIALFDIGASGIYGPYADVSQLFALIDGARLVDESGQWAVPCNTIIPISFTIGQRNYTLQPTDYLIGPAAGNPNLCLSWPRALPPSADGIDWQIGSAFLRTVYSVFSFGINSKEPPMIGLYSLQNATSSDSPDSISSFLSSMSATVATTLPNFILPTPTYTTPPYALNSSVTAPIGGIAPSGLATSTYVPVLGQSIFNVSALPTISPTPTMATFIITDGSGMVTTSTSLHPLAAVTLGVPPGWSAGTSLRAPFFSAVIPYLVGSLTLLFVTGIIL